MIRKSVVTMVVMERGEIVVCCVIVGDALNERVVKYGLNSCAEPTWNDAEYYENKICIEE